MRTGAGTVEIAPAYTAACEIFGFRGLQERVQELDNQIPAVVQTKMILEGRRLVERGTRWLLRHRRSPLDIDDTVSFFAPGASEVADRLPELLRGIDREWTDDMRTELEEEGVPGELAERVACLPALFCALDQVAVADEEDESIAAVTEVYYELAERLHLDWLREQIGALPRETRWQTLARDALREDFFTQHHELTAEVLHATDTDAEIADRISTWLDRNGPQVRRCERMLTEIQSAKASDLAMLSVGLREIRNLVRAAA